MLGNGVPSFSSLCLEFLFLKRREGSHFVFFFRKHVYNYILYLYMSMYVCGLCIKLIQ